MLVAKDKHGKLITAYKKNEQEISQLRHDAFTCPECNEKVILRAGRIKVPHFAHEQQGSCSVRQGESAEHLNGKIDIKQWCHYQGYPSALEYALPEVGQRIDVVAKIGKTPVAFEYQCASISLEEFEARTNGIRKAGFMPIWIFGEQYLNSLYNHSFRLSPLMKSAITKEPPFNQPILLFYSTSQKRLTILTQFFSSQFRCFVQRKHIPLQKVGIELFRNMPMNFPLTNFKTYWLKEKQRLRTMQRKHTSEHDKKFMLMLYQQYLHPQYLPACIHLPVQSSYRLLIPNYIWQTQFLLSCWKKKNIGEEISWTEALTSCNELFTNTITTQFSTHWVHPLYEYLTLLSSFGYLQKTPQGWVVLKHPRFPKTLDEALLFDRNILAHFGETLIKKRSFFLQSVETAIK
uniref:competence protein CoiA n=1 Tax=uncultured Allobacillus sp. TaxID=1638025 RepID=UPI002596A99A|nr:competence protein CoiA family protein [uncultured Allobacillus sp.]